MDKCRLVKWYSVIAMIPTIVGRKSNLFDIKKIAALTLAMTTLIIGVTKRQ